MRFKLLCELSQLLDLKRKIIEFNNIFFQINEMQKNVLDEGLDDEIVDRIYCIHQLNNKKQAEKNLKSKNQRYNYAANIDTGVE